MLGFSPYRGLKLGGRLCVFALFPGALCLWAHDPITTKVTWNREMSRIVFMHCASCHHDGGAAFSLMTYREARPWAKAIKDETLNRRMPPWNAVKGFGEFKDDRGLTQDTLELIADWVEGGAPEGDPKLAPKPPKPAGLVRPKPEQPGREVIVDGRLKLTSALDVAGIRAKSMQEGSSVQVVAERPDGEIVPLLWLYNYQPKYDRVYYYEQPVQLPSGAVIRTSPSSAGTVALVTERASSASLSRDRKPAR